MASMDNVGQAGIVGGSHQMKAMAVSAAVEGGIAHGAGVRAEAGAAMMDQSVSGFVGYDRNNPLLEAGAGYKLMSAEASADLLEGDDGRRVGFAGGAEAAASAASGSLTGEENLRIGWLPFVPDDWTIGVRAQGEGYAGGGAVGAEGHGYYDKLEERAHLGAGGKLAALLGVGFDFDISIGRGYQSRERRELE